MKYRKGECVRDVKWSLQETQNTETVTDRQSHYPLKYAALYWAAGNSEKSSVLQRWGEKVTTDVELTKLHTAK